MPKTIEKRDGRIVEYNRQKVWSAIDKANANSEMDVATHSDIIKILDKIEEKYPETTTVEKVQDLIEEELMNLGHNQLAKRYIIYRNERSKKRNIKGNLLNYKKLMDDYLNVDDWRVKENASVSYSLGGLILSNSGAVTANYWLSEVYTEEIAEAHRNADIHIHDLSMLSGYCFTGDTRIASLDGNKWSFEDLVASGKKELWVYTYDHNSNEILPALAINPRITRIVSELAIITLDNGKQIKCTVDHPFLMRDGTYTPASLLSHGDSLMPLYVNYNRYAQIGGSHTSTGKKEYVHRWIYGKIMGMDVPDDMVVHHVDENKLNNSPENLRLMLDKDHRSHEMIKTMETDKWKNANTQYGETLINRNKSDRMRNNASKHALSQNRENGKFVSKMKEAISFVQNDNINNDEYNHKVADVSIIQLENPVYVYDMEVPRTHNFALDSGVFVHNCAGWSLKQLIQEGLGGVVGKISSAPAAHLSTLCNQMVNFLGIMQNEWAGAQAFSSFDTYLAPFVKIDNLSYKQTKQCIQSFVYGVNTPSRWGTQAPFSNITLDWNCPLDLKDLPAIVGGELQDFTYGDCKEEMDMINKAFIEVMVEGDANGRGHAYPIPSYSITKDFDWSETENNKLLFEMAAKYGIPYFSNYVNSDMEPSDVRSMCPLTGDTLVPVKLYGENILRLYDIKTIYDLDTNVKVMTKFGVWADARPIKMPMTKVYRITLNTGAHVDMGEHHLQPTLRADAIESIEARFLSIGDFVPVVCGIPLADEISETEEENHSGYGYITDIQEIECDNEYLYCFEVDNEDHLFVLANGVVTHNCRLRLDLRELRKKSGGFFGSGESTGSVGVVSINMPKLGYLSENVEDFYQRLDHIMDVSAKSLKIKRNTIEKLMEDGLYPYTKRYLGTFNNHFSTIGLVGMNEMCLNAKWIGMDLRHEEAQKFTEEVLNHMRARLSDYQEQYGDLYNLEATPAESTSYRFAKHDLEKYPDIINAACYNRNGDSRPYYTNSSHLPVGTTDDVFQALDVQDNLQVLYTSGTVFHTFLGEKLPNWKAAATLVRKIAENYKLPYYTLSPTYSVCHDHGYIVGEHYTCPICGKTTEVYSRITGYYRAVQNWNDGKAQEFKDRKEYVVDENEDTKFSFGIIEDLTITKGTGETWIDNVNEENDSVTPYGNEDSPTTFSLRILTTPTCSNCKIVKGLMDKKGIDYETIDITKNTIIAEEYKVHSVPALIVTYEKNGLIIKHDVIRTTPEIIEFIKYLK